MFLGASGSIAGGTMCARPSIPVGTYWSSVEHRGGIGVEVREQALQA